MKQRFDPDFEFEWGPVLLATATVFLVGLVGTLLAGRPSWVGFGAVLAGFVTSFASGYYESSANNATLGTVLGVFLLMPVFTYTRAAVLGVEGTSDTLFAFGPVSLVLLLVTMMGLVPVSYLSATLSDFVRKKVGGPIGYSNSS